MLLCTGRSLLKGFLLVYFSGAPAMTSRSFKEEEFVKVVELIDRGVEIGLNIQKKQSTSKNSFLFVHSPQ